MPQNSFIYKEYSRDDESGGLALLFYRVFSVVVLLLLMVTLYRNLTGSIVSLNFTGFLQGLQTVPQINMSWVSSITSSNISWLRNVPIIGDFLGLMIDLFAFALWLSLALIQFGVYVAWFFGFVFGV